MTTHKGFSLLIAVVIVAVVAVLGGGTYVALHPEVMSSTADTVPAGQPDAGSDAADGVSGGVPVSGKIGIAWNFAAAAERDGIPYTKVTLLVSGQPHVIGEYMGSCNEVGAEGGIDGKGLLTGEVAAAQCYYAGGGNEIGVFGKEDGGIEVMVGELDEGGADYAAVRGAFKLRTDISL